MKKRQGSDHPKEGIRFLPFIGQTEKAEKTAVYTTQSPEVPKGTFRDCKQSPRSRQARTLARRLCKKRHPHDGNGCLVFVHFILKQ